MRARGAAATAVVAVLLALPGCTDSQPPQSPEPPGTALAPPPAKPKGVVWTLDDAGVDTMPAKLRPGASALPASFPPDDAEFPDVLADPPGRAVVTYSPRESFQDRGGWATERVFFRGVDGGWRSLELGDLGLPESTWPGPDTYGAGNLSPDGRWWAARTNAGVLLLDLRTAEWAVTPLPGRYTNYVTWTPDGTALAVVRQGRTAPYRTYFVDPRTGAVQGARYRLPLDGFAPDGSVVTFGERRGLVVRTVRQDDEVSREVLPDAPYRYLRQGAHVGSSLALLTVRRGLLAVDSETMRPVARLDMGRYTEPAWPRGWMRPQTAFFTDQRLGLLTWSVRTGQVRVLTRPSLNQDRPGTSWWSASVAENLMG